MPTLETRNFSAPKGQRILQAFGKYLNTQDLTDPANPVPRDATKLEVEAAIENWVKQIVFAHERRVAREAADQTIADLDPA